MLAIVLILVLLVTPAHAESVVEVARSQLGKGEIGGNNRGPEVKKYTRGQEVPWCAAFVSWVLLHSRSAGKSRGYILAARSYWQIYSDKRCQFPSAGDIIVFSRGTHYGHVGIVEKVRGNSITTIEGNVSEVPGTSAKVIRRNYTVGKIKNLVGFIRL